MKIIIQVIVRKAFLSLKTFLDRLCIDHGDLVSGEMYVTRNTVPCNCDFAFAL